MPSTYTFSRDHDGNWDVWKDTRLVGENFETVDEAVEWLKNDQLS